MEPLNLPFNPAVDMKQLFWKSWFLKCLQKAWERWIQSRERFCLNSLLCQVSAFFGLPWWLGVKNLCANAGNAGDAGWIPGRGKIPWTRKRQPTPVFLPRILWVLARHSPWDRKWVGHSLVTKRQQSNNCLLYISEKIGKWKCSNTNGIFKGPMLVLLRL